MEHFLYPFLCSQTLRLLSCLDYCKTVLQWTLSCMYLFKLLFSPGICREVGLVGHMVILFLVFYETPTLFSITVVPIYIPSNSVGGFSSLHTFSSIYCLWIFWQWPFQSVWPVFLICVSLISDVEHLVLFSHLYIFFGEMSI